MPKPAKAAAKPAKPPKKRQPAQKTGESGAIDSLEHPPRGPAPEFSGLNERQRQFVLEYLVDLNATQAAIRAGYSKATAHVIGQENLRKPAINAAVQQARKAREHRTEITADRAVREAWAIMTADPREIMEYRVGCCRHCWGDDHRYQRTPAEFEAAETAYALAAEKAITEGKPVAEFDPRGGSGYDLRRDPNPQCPECGGEGVGRPVFKDLRHVSPAAASLFAGVKVTKEGIEVRVHSKDAAMDKVFRHLGLYNDKIQLTMPQVIVKDLTGRKD